MDHVFIATIFCVILIEIMCPLTIIMLDINIPGCSQNDVVDDDDDGDAESEDDRKSRRFSVSESQAIKKDTNPYETREVAHIGEQNVLNADVTLEGWGEEKMMIKDSMNSFDGLGRIEKSNNPTRYSLCILGQAARVKADEKTLTKVINLVIITLSFVYFICLSYTASVQLTVSLYFQTTITSAIVHNPLFRAMKYINKEDIATFTGEDVFSREKFLTNCKPEVKTVDYDWFLTPLHFVQTQSDKVLTVFPAFQDVIHRLASYRNIVNDLMLTPLSTSELSQNGFYYTGSGSLVKCEKCGKEVELRSFTAENCMIDPKSSRFHNAGCANAEYNQPNYVDDKTCNQQDNISDTTSSHNMTNPRPKMLKVLVVFPPLFSTNATRSHYVHPTEQELALTSEVPNRGELWGNVAPLVLSNCAANQFRSEDSFQTSNTEGWEASGSSAGESDNGEASTTAADQAPSEALSVIFTETEVVTPEQGSVHDIKTDTLHRITCEKNPGHYGSHPMNQLKIEHIPPKTRHQDVLKFLQLFSMLTVRIVVNVTSSLHREIDPSCSNGNEPRIGTGFVSLENEAMDDGAAGGSGQGERGTVKQFVKALIEKAKGEIRIETNRHLVVDNTEAANTSVEFFCDQPSRRGIKAVRGVTVLHSEVSGDSRTILICKTSDHGFADHVLHIKRQLMDAAGKLPARAKEMMCRKVFIISHPHGQEKFLSYGDSVQVKYAINPTAEKGRRVIKISTHEEGSSNVGQPMKMLMYAAETCPGSCGAPVISFKAGPRDSNGQTTYQLDIWIHTGVDKKNSLGCSTMKGCTEEDFQGFSNSRTQTSAPYQRDSDSDDDQGSNSAGEASNVFKVLSHPTYPSHISYQKRLESFVSWPAHHIATPIFLAMAGFFYAGYADCVRCFQCGLGLRSWKAGDNVYDEHRKHRPNCPFLQAQLRAGVSTTERTIPQADAVHCAASNETTVATPDSTKDQQELSATGWTKMMDTLTHQSLMLPDQTVTDSFAICDQQTNIPTFSENSTHSQPPTDMTLKLLRSENTKLQVQLLCKVCFQAPCRDLFLPCGELYACTDCSKLLTHCPSCSRQILATVTTYLT